MEIFSYNTIISLIIFNLLLKVQLKIILNKDSQISITIKGRGNQKILFDQTFVGMDGVSRRISYNPSKIYVNEVLQNYTGKMVYNLENDINNITMIFNSLITNAGGMFLNMENITKIDLSKFNSSAITYMGYMFYGCISLISLNLDNLDTSLVKYMNHMFYNCKSLKSLDLSNLNTSSLIDMYCMFSLCNSLEYLNILILL